MTTFLWLLHPSLDKCSIAADNNIAIKLRNLQSIKLIYQHHLNFSTTRSPTKAFLTHTMMPYSKKEWVVLFVHAKIDALSTFFFFQLPTFKTKVTNLFDWVTNQLQHNITGHFARNRLVTQSNKLITLVEKVGNWKKGWYLYATTSW